MLRKWILRTYNRRGLWLKTLYFDPAFPPGSGFITGDYEIDKERGAFIGDTFENYLRWKYPWEYYPWKFGGAWWDVNFRRDVR